MRSDLAAMETLCAHLRDGRGPREGAAYATAKWARGALDLGGSALDRDAATRLADALAHDRTVRALVLSVTGLDDDAWTPLADVIAVRGGIDALALSHNALAATRAVGGVRALDLSGNALGDGAVAWIDAQMHAPRLRTLGVAGVGLTVDGVARLTERIDALPTLTGIALGEDDPASQSAVRAWLSRGPRLDALSVGIDGDDLARWFDALRALPLRALELRGGDGGIAWHDALAAFVRGHPTLRALSLDARRWELSAWRAFAGALAESGVSSLRVCTELPMPVRGDCLAALARAPREVIPSVDDFASLRPRRVRTDGAWNGAPLDATPRGRPRRAVEDHALVTALDTLRALSRRDAQRDPDDAVLASLRDAARDLLVVGRAPRRPPAPRTRPTSRTTSQRFDVAPDDGAPPPWKCYVCRHAIRVQHPRYPRMCLACGAFNLARRERRVDLSGRVFLLTGARVGIGHAVACRLLRAGATVVATTRFPHDALRRFDALPDADAWRARLTVHGIDLRHLPQVEAFGHHLVDALDRLDGVIHNAAQTVWLPPSAYDPLRALEHTAPAALPAPWQTSLGSRFSPLDDHRLGESSGGLAVRDDPTINSWRLRLGEIPMRELVEVQAVNAIAPAVLSNALRPLLERPPETDRWLVFVSAPEGQFGYRKKSVRHPHTNMAKAAVNMLVRTAAPDWARSRIWMTAVDPGWVSNQNPPAMAADQEARGLVLPLDVEDGAARVLDPIENGAATGENLYGVLLKDYKPAPW